MQISRFGVLTSILCLILAVALVPLSSNLLRWTRGLRSVGKSSVLTTRNTGAESVVGAKTKLEPYTSTSIMPRTPVYFFSHGGPNIMVT